MELFTVDKAGTLALLSPFPVGETEPYGLCMGRLGDEALVFVTHKNGAVRMWRVVEVGPRGANVQFLGRLKLKTQIEGCVFDDQAAALFVGEENKGIWRFDFTPAGVAQPKMIAKMGSGGLTADVEGLALYKTQDGGYLVASSQGSNSYVLYDRYPPHAPRGRITIEANAAFGIDGTEETDGLEATSIDLGPSYPEGALVVQDGVRPATATTQNFKIVDWRDVAAVMSYGATRVSAPNVYAPTVTSDDNIMPFEGGVVLGGAQ